MVDTKSPCLPLKKCCKVHNIIIPTDMLRLMFSPNENFLAMVLSVTLSQTWTQKRSLL